MPGVPLRPIGTGRVSRGELLRRRRFPFSLQTRIVLVVLVCVVVPLLLMGGYLLKQTETALGARARATVFNELQRRADDVDAWMEMRAAEPRSWSRSLFVYDVFDSRYRRWVGPNDTADESTRYLTGLLKRNSQYESLFVVDLRGNPLTWTAEEELEPLALAMLQEPKSSDDIVTGLYHSRRLNKPTMLVMFGIDPSGKDSPADPANIRGFFVGRVETGDLEGLLAPGPDPDSPALWLLDSNGRVLIANGRVEPQLASRTFPGTLPDPASKAALDAQEADLAGLGPTVYQVRPLRNPLGWHVAASIPSTGAYKAVADARARLLTAGVPAVIVIFALAYFLARGMLRPILLLSEGAQRVSAGDLDVHLPVRGRDELADLTSAFNDMARRVRESRDQLGETAAALARTNDQLEQAKERFRTQAITDALTGLFNRRHFEDSLDEQIERASAEPWPLSLLLLDLDHFKQYNDRWGHTEGDAELRRVAALVQRTVRSTDIAFRYGGEELAVLLPSCAKDQAVGVAEKVRLAVGSGTQRPSRFGARTTVSVGVATFPEDGRVARGLVDTADAALYQAKAQGRDRVVAAGGPQDDGPASDRRATG